MNLTEQHYWIPFPDLLSVSGKGSSGILDGFLAGPENQLVANVLYWILEEIPIQQPLTRSPKTISLKRDKTATPGTSKRSSDAFHKIPYLSPLVFYGESGCGKSHLIRGLYQEIRQRNANHQGIYLTANDFYRSLSNAISHKEAVEFRDFFSQSCIAVIEDIDFLSNHPVGQEELLSILNRCQNSQTLFILSMSSYPADLNGFSEALTARMISGMTIPVAFPSPESCKILVSKLSESLDLHLSSKIIDYLIQKVPNKVNALFGILNQIKIQFEKTPKSLSLQSIENILTQRHPVQTRTLDDIAKTTARYFSIRLSDLRSKKRTRTISLARNITIYLARKMTDQTLQELGDWFSGRDHTTILYGYREIDAKSKENIEIKKALQKIQKSLES
ncbi:MAG: DnaA/Hda family protein [Planctomycetia bacterium]|nr:DnaA/Hda family protein [Planctomycetia bacterium]